MSFTEIDALARAHALFPGDVSKSAEATLPPVTPGHSPERDLSETPSSISDRNYHAAIRRSAGALAASKRTDEAISAVVAEVYRDHASAHRATGHVLESARIDASSPPQTPLAYREALRRRISRLRSQRAHILSARLSAAHHAAMLRGLHYRSPHRGNVRSLSPVEGDRASAAVRAALSRLGRPYVWGATGPNSFDCSGLVQWAYARAGVPLGRTTYEQIADGIAVPRSQVQPGDLIFPHIGHVQLAIGHGLVVEAPHTGATVRISRLGDAIAIRRPF